MNLNKSLKLKECIGKFKDIEVNSNVKSYRECIRKQLNEYIKIYIKDFKSLGFQLGIDYDDIVIVDSVYRNTSKNVVSNFKSVGAAHTDFDPFMTDYAFVYPFLDRWGSKLENTLGDKVYDNLYWKIGKPIIKVCNIWISLSDPYIKNDHLCFCDLNTFDSSQIVPYIASRRETEEKRENNFIAQGIKFSSKNKWYTKQNMKMGEAYIFESFKTPHGSVHVDNNFSRRSIECRVLFIKHKDIPKKVQKFYLK